MLGDVDLSCSGSHPETIGSTADRHTVRRIPVYSGKFARARSSTRSMMTIATSPMAAPATAPQMSSGVPPITPPIAAPTIIRTKGSRQPIPIILPLGTRDGARWNPPDARRFTAQAAPPRGLHPGTICVAGRGGIEIPSPPGHGAPRRSAGHPAGPSASAERQPEGAAPRRRAPPAGTARMAEETDLADAPASRTSGFARPVETIDTSPAISDTMKTTTCYMCACRCGIRVHLKDGRIRYIEGNPDHPVNQRRAVRQGLRRHHEHYSPARLTKPLLRTGERGAGDFKEIEWEEALALATQWLGDIRATEPRKLALLHRPRPEPVLHRLVGQAVRHAQLRRAWRLLLGQHGGRPASIPSAAASGNSAIPTGTAPNTC